MTESRLLGGQPRFVFPSWFLLVMFVESIVEVRLPVRGRAESFDHAGPSLHCGLNAPPTASQAFVPGGASAVRQHRLGSNGARDSNKLLPDLFHLTIKSTSSALLPQEKEADWSPCASGSAGNFPLLEARFRLVYRREHWSGSNGFPARSTGGVPAR
jgi:hypothetical protein